MKICSVNISKSKTVIYDGREIKTGIFKQPTNESVTIDKLNIIGDEQADLVFHGGEHKAVYAFAENHYDYWQKELDAPELSNGAFGENFTVSNLMEDSVLIGNQYRFGTALLEVSQPRIPCFKLGIALKNKYAPKLFTQHYCTGVYFRVIETGVAQLGDNVSLEHKADHDISIKTLFQAYYDKDYVDAIDVFTKAKLLATLAPEWQLKLEKKLRKVNLR